jgi:hypothetical protein
VSETDTILGDTLTWNHEGGRSITGLYGVNQHTHSCGCHRSCYRGFRIVTIFIIVSIYSYIKKFNKVRCRNAFMSLPTSPHVEFWPLIIHGHQTDRLGETSESRNNFLTSYKNTNWRSLHIFYYLSAPKFHDTGSFCRAIYPSSDVSINDMCTLLSSKWKRVRESNTKFNVLTEVAVTMDLTVMPCNLVDT